MLLDTHVLADLLGIEHLKILDRKQAGEMPSPVQGAALSQVYFELEDGGSIPALIYTPTASASRGTVLALHQHNNEYAYGKSEPAGVDGDPDAAYGKALAGLGYTVVCPDFIGFEERRFKNDQADEFLAAMKAITEGGCLHGRMASEALAIVNYLRSEHDPDEMFSVIGHSLGGQIALLVGALSEAVTHLAVSAGVTTMEACFELRISHNPGWYVPKLQQHGDYPAIARLLNNKKALFVCHEADNYFPRGGAQKFLNALPSAGVEKLWLNQEHAMTPASLGQIVRWFEEIHAPDAI